MIQSLLFLHENLYFFSHSSLCFSLSSLQFSTSYIASQPISYLFDLFFYQILMMRIHQDIYDHLKTYPRRLVIPHRLNPYPVDVRENRFFTLHYYFLLQVDIYIKRFSSTCLLYIYFIRKLMSLLKTCKQLSTRTVS